MNKWTHFVLWVALFVTLCQGCVTSHSTNETLQHTSVPHGVGEADSSNKFVAASVEEEFSSTSETQHEELGNQVLVTAYQEDQSGQLSLDGLTALALERNPELQRLSFAIQSSRGRAYQAGLYPNPTLTITGDELGSRISPGGVITAPFISQEIVTAGKLKFRRAVLHREVDQRTLNLMAERYILLATVRRGYFDVLTIQRRLKILDDLLVVANNSIKVAEPLFEAQEIAELDLIQFRVERNRIVAERDATKRQLNAAFRRLSANLGVPNLATTKLVDIFDLPDPIYDLESAQQLVSSVHPRLRASQAAVGRAQAYLCQAEAEAIPNITVGAGYVRQNKDREDDWTFQVGVPIPLFDRNQGNIAAARADIGSANRQVAVTKNDLISELAANYGEFASSKERVERFRSDILPDAKKAYDLSVDAFQGGQFEYLRVLQAQRTVAETNLDYVKALGDMWKSASDISGLLLEENWPQNSLSTPLPLPMPDAVDGE